MSVYSWIITEDHLDGEETNVTGPRGSTTDWKANPNQGVEFKMYDDDQELYYTGRIVGDYDGFEPMDDFGTPNAGCTGIMYKNETTGEWEYL